MDKAETFDACGSRSNSRGGCVVKLRAGTKPPMRRQLSLANFRYRPKPSAGQVPTKSLSLDKLKGISEMPETRLVLPEIAAVPADPQGKTQNRKSLSVGRKSEKLLAIFRHEERLRHDNARARQEAIFSSCRQLLKRRVHQAAKDARWAEKMLDRFDSQCKMDATGVQETIDRRVREEYRRQMEAQRRRGVNDVAAEIATETGKKMHPKPDAAVSFKCLDSVDQELKYEQLNRLGRSDVLIMPTQSPVSAKRSSRINKETLHDKFSRDVEQCMAEMDGIKVRQDFGRLSGRRKCRNALGWEKTLQSGWKRRCARATRRLLLTS